MGRLTIPQLSKGRPHFCFCMMAEPWDEAVDWLQKNGEWDRVTTSYQAESGETIWVEAILEFFDNEHTLHFHLEFFAGEPEERGTEIPFADMVKGLEEFVGLSQDNEGFVQSHAKICVDRSSIPEHGLVAKLLHFNQSSCGAKFSLAGATLRMEDAAFTKMTFQQNDEADELSIELWAEGFSVIDNTILSSFFDLLATGFDCFAFERLSREQLSTR
jgi:hypothetical protein